MPQEVFETKISVFEQPKTTLLPESANLYTV